MHYLIALVNIVCICVFKVNPVISSALRIENLGRVEEIAEVQKHYSYENSVRNQRVIYFYFINNYLFQIQ